jgi:outer membrane biosynthesis protein TonB
LSCPVKPEVIQFLGKTVVMEVGTDVKGKVVNTVMQESSHSLAYDELAICLVKHWGFEPAIAQSEPVANDGLIVRITIDRG